MSYARFSSDDWKSDVYVYDAGIDDEIAITIHVARYRTENVPEAPEMDKMGTSEFNVNRFLKQHRAQMDFLKTAPRVRIESKYAGGNYRDLSYEDAIELLLDMRKHGIHVPNGCIEGLRGDAGLEHGVFQ